MSQHLTLQAKKRELKGTSESKRLRKIGIVPSIVYGSSQREYPIQVNSTDFLKIYKSQSSKNFILNLEIEGAKEKTKLAIVQELQRDPLTGVIIHVDFRAVSENETIHANVPVSLEGDPAGVKSGGLLEQLIRNIEVHCKPNDLPESIKCDVSSLQVGDSIKIGDLQFPSGVATKMDQEVLVALVAQTRASVSEGSSDSTNEDKKED